VAEQLKQSILLGHFEPGDRLPSERELSSEFQVSRVAVREALRALENSGFIITRQGNTGGAFITDLTFQHLANAFIDLLLADKISIPELHYVRRLIEPDVARLAAMRITPEYAERLREAVKAEELPVSSIAEEVDGKTVVHFLLAEMCGNRFLEALVRSVLGLSKKIVETIEEEPQSLHPAGMHHPIIEAVIAGDPGKAAKAMEKHTIEFGKNLMRMEKTFLKKKKIRKPS
jgi:DNA-binding FadR family transcriptional regulator